MPRPRKWRRICALPITETFGPLDNDRNESHVVIMGLDEYEAVRLIDLEGLMQEECAVIMNVARTTVQKIYNDARKKIALALVKGYTLKIEGGDYRLCHEEGECFGCPHCCRKRREASQKSS